MKTQVRLIGFPSSAHDDIPEDVQQQLYVEEQQRRDRKQTDATASPSSMSPIHITNVLPGQSHQIPLAVSQPAASTFVQPPKSTTASSLDVPGLHDVEVMNKVIGSKRRSKMKPGKLSIRKRAM